MLFNSVRFLVFFPVVTTLYFLLPFSYRWLLLLAASCVFYMDFIPAYILILFLLIIVDYLAALWMERTTGPARKAILVCSLASNVGMLGLFKYFNFFNANLAQAAAWLNLPYAVPSLSLILPIGLSFHTFQSMSYTIEVYRGTVKAERHLGIYALYVLFYPQLVAGPIERPQHLLGQFLRAHAPRWDRIAPGLKLMLVGFVKKVAIADTLSIAVNAVYRDPASFSPASLLVAAYFFAFQILYDFSGYTDIARGAASVMGFELMINFDRPYAARNVSEFWKRWHISLSTWFRDYLYIPLGGNRVAPLRRYANLMIVFVVSGFWHGANWTFIAWGAVHGAYLILADLGSGFTAKIRSALAAGLGRRAWSAASVILTFHLVTLAWIFFRASSLTQALDIIRRLFARYEWAAVGRELGTELVLISIVLVAGMEAAQWLQKNGKLSRSLPQDALVRQSLSYAWMFAAIALIAARVTYDAAPQQFIYFQF